MAKVELWRHGLLEFLLQASLLRPVVKYTALAFFAHRFLPSLIEDDGANARSCWLLRPLRESNLQLFALVSIWISTKVIRTRLYGGTSIRMRVSISSFELRIRSECRRLRFQVLGYDIGASNIAFVHLEDLLVQFRELSKLGELVALDVCMEIMDLLYETEDASLLFRAPYALAASTLVTAYVISVPKQRWEFPLLPWVKFVTSYDEEEIAEIVTRILTHVLQPEGIKQRIDEHFLP
uniref:Cyclin-J18-like n=1 Tax=Ananas comosus var. bracteatus TaxID=296719 RepID=A0A6V7Q2Y8_ANACO|nr:unnamed protein product [Ananas comosus var. bracteatus]